MTTNFKITDITCDACIKLSYIALKRLPGVKNIDIKSNGLAIVESDQAIAWEDIKNVLAEVDKKASLI